MSKRAFLSFSFDGFVMKVITFIPALVLALVLFPNDARALDVQCEVPNHIVCNVSDPDGFMSVRVNVDFGDDLGQIDVVTQTYMTCRTNATVSWDIIQPNFDILTTSCTSESSEFTVGSVHSTSVVPVVQGFHAHVSKANHSVSLTPIRYARHALVSGASGRIERYAKQKALILDGAGLMSIDADEFSLSGAPITELNADNDIVFPIDVMVIDILSERSDLPPGVYKLRLDRRDNARDVGQIEFINEFGRVAEKLAVNVEPLGTEPNISGFNFVAEQGSAQKGQVCGKKKCFVWKRDGFLKWKFGCTNKETGAVVACVG